MGFTYPDFLVTRAHALRQPAPLLQFYEVEIPDGTFERYVDFADRDAGGSLPNRIPFNGVEFISIPISRGDLQESAEGSSFELPVTVHDPLHRAAYLLRTYRGLEGQKVRFWIAAYDNLAHPEDAYREDFEVISSTLSQGPDAATIILGHPNLYETRRPNRFYDRRKCINPYHDRFTPGSWCTYPSNEFGAQRKEAVLPTARYEEQFRKHGWMSQQARRASSFDIHLSSPGELTIASVESRIAWKGRERYGPSFYRSIAGDFDVECQLSATGRPRFLAGLLIADLAAASPYLSGSEELPAYPLSSSLLWGLQETGSSVRLAARRTEGNVTGPDTATVAAEGFLRVVRTGNSFACYSRSSSSSSWSLRTTQTLVLPDPCRVGLVLSSDDRTTALLTAHFGYIRFALGGLPSCKRSWEDCGLHGNTVQFNGFREMPSDRARY
jgi:hypothetical protein